MQLKSETRVTMRHDTIFYVPELEEVYDVRATMEAYAALVEQSPFVKWCRVNDDHSITYELNLEADLEAYIVGYTPDDDPIYCVWIPERYNRIAAIKDGAFVHEMTILDNDYFLVPRRPFRQN